MSSKIKKAQMTPREQVGKYIHDKREKAERTQWDVADHFKYTTAQYVSNWERGVAYPPIRQLPELAKVIGCKPKELVQLVKKAKQKEIEEEFAELEKGLRK